MFAIALATNSVIAFERPRGGPDGIYMHYFDANGTASAIHLNSISNAPPYVPSESSTIESHRRRGTGTVFCSNGSAGPAFGPPSDFQGATEALANWFGNGRAFFGPCVSAYVGEAVAYGCNYGIGQTYTATQVWSDMTLVNNTCPPVGSVVGWVDHPEWQSAYGREVSSQSFCHRG